MAFQLRFKKQKDFPCGSAGKEFACNSEELGSIPELGWSPGEGKGCPLQYSGLENTVDCIVHGVTKNQTQLSDFHWQIKGLQPCTENIQWQEHMQRSWCGIRIESSTETNSCLWPLGEMDMEGGWPSTAFWEAGCNSSLHSMCYVSFASLSDQNINT